MDLSSGTTREAAAKYNSQIEYGADVISRINYARQPGGAEALHRAILQDIDTLIDDLVRARRRSAAATSTAWWPRAIRPCCTSCWGWKPT